MYEILCVFCLNTIYEVWVLIQMVVMGVIFVWLFYPFVWAMFQFLASTIIAAHQYCEALEAADPTADCKLFYWLPPYPLLDLFFHLSVSGTRAALCKQQAYCAPGARTLCRVDAMLITMYRNEMSARWPRYPRSTMIDHSHKWLFLCPLFIFYIKLHISPIQISGSLFTIHRWCDV